MSDRDPCRFTVLWATSARFDRPQFIAAFAEGLEDAMSEEFDAKVAEAKEWFLSFGDGDEDPDGPWTFWTTHEAVARPEPVDA